MSHYPRFLYSFPEPTWWNGPPSKWSDDPYYFEPSCTRCDDAGCFECCPPEPITLEDLDNIQHDIDHHEGVLALTHGSSQDQS